MMESRIKTDNGDEIVLQESHNDEKVNLTVENYHHHLTKKEALTLASMLEQWFQ